MTTPEPDDTRSPDDLARDEARTAVRSALYRMGRAAGAAFTEQPIFEGARSTEQVMDPAAAIRMSLMLRDAASQLLHRQLRRARCAGIAWDRIGKALNLADYGQERGVSLAEAAFEYATEGTRSQPFDPVSFSYTCSACGQHVTDRGPYDGHPLDNEEGHAEDCARMAEAVRAYEARWGDDGD